MKIINTNKEIIPIFFATDDNFIPFVAVSIESMLAKASKEYFYDVKVLYTNVSKENIENITKYSCENVLVEFVDISETIDKVSSKLHIACNDYTKTTYYRLFIADLYPQYDKALYLDGDILIREDISKLYNIEIGDNLVGAASDDFVMLTPKIHRYMLNCLGMRDIKYYFNAGILIMNLKQFREQKFEDQLIDLLQKYSFPVQDQDYLNVICMDKVAYISHNWNRMPVNDNEPMDADKVNLVHYNLRWKPWKFPNLAFSDEFWDFAKKTAYYEKIKSIFDNTTDEDRRQAIENVDKFMDVIAKDGENPFNYYNQYVKSQVLNTEDIYYDDEKKSTDNVD